MFDIFQEKRLKMNMLLVVEAGSSEASGMSFCSITEDFSLCSNDSESVTIPGQRQTCTRGGCGRITPCAATLCAYAAHRSNGKRDMQQSPRRRGTVKEREARRHLLCTPTSFLITLNYLYILCTI